jgi:hypothetical protein
MSQRHALLLASALAGVLAAVPAAAQQPTPSKSIFSQVVPQPTGRNGYEELVLAGERLQSSKLYLAIRDTYATAPIAEKRRVLADKPVVDALRLVRKGLAKQVVSPRVDLSFETLLPEMGPFRDLARVLAMQTHLQLADGRVPEALETARTCIFFGRAIQADTLIGGLVGIAVETISIRTLGAHLEQLSARDCEQLHRICLQALALPDPQPRIMAIEYATTRRTIADILDKVKAQGPEALKPLFGGSDEEFEEAAQFIRVTPPAELDRLAALVVRSLDEQSERVQTELRKQPWERQRALLEPAQEGGLASFAARFLPSVTASSDAFSREQAYLRLLACHAAILRYRWEHDRLPRSLDELNLGVLAIDPFTGAPLEYRMTGRQYLLTSVGPVSSADNPRAVDGRVPVSVDGR